MDPQLSATPATALLARHRVAHRLHPYPHDAGAVAGGLGYGDEAAAALGVDPGRVLKTLVVRTDTGLAVAVVSVADSLDLKAVADALGCKRAEMAAPADAQRATGYVVGGISPLAQRKRLPTVLDGVAAAHPDVLVSAGRRGLDVELATADLLRLTGACTAPIARRPPRSGC